MREAAWQRTYWCSRLSALAALCLLAAGSIATPFDTATAQAPAISVAPTITAEAASQAPLAIRIAPADAIPRNSFVRLRGLPSMAALSEGHSIAPGAWAVPLVALPNLKITLPAGTAGKSEFVVTLVGSDGAVLAAAKSTLIIAAARPVDRDDPRASGPPASATILRAGTPSFAAPSPERSAGPAPRVPAMTPEDRDRATRLLRKGDEHLSEGNIAAARLFYERAADVGLAEAAMALAGTYDTSELSRLHALGITPNAAEARRWYERARELGAAGAADKLRRLGAN